MKAGSFTTRGRPRTLKVRLVLIVVALMAAVSLLIGVASVALLRSYLLQQLDESLVDSAQISANFAIPENNDASSGQFQRAGQAAFTILGYVKLPDSNDSSQTDAVLKRAAYTDAKGTLHFLTQNELTRLAGITVDGAPHTLDLGDDLGEYRVIAGAPSSNGDLIITGLPMSNVEAVTRQVALVITFLALAGLAFAAAAGTVVVSAALRPLNRVAGTAMTVSRLPLDRGDVDISARVPGEYTDTETEVGKVGSALNTLLGHVESALAARQRSEDKVRRFVADASHELRTPLASIRGYSELTRRTQKDLPDEVTRSLGRIESEAVRMTSLVEDLLLLARLDSQPELRRDEVDVSLMVVEAVGDAHAAGPDHIWSVDIPEEPVAVLGDDPRLRQVIVNLLANARTHTPPGTEIEASVVQEGEEVLLRVHDNGPGIDPSIADTLFERFTRADTSRARTTGSTGLGLSIVSAVAQAHGGTVSVESIPGDTTFTVRLPAAVSSALADDTPEASEADELHDSAETSAETTRPDPR